MAKHNPKAVEYLPYAMLSPYSDQQLIVAARLYFVDEQSQAEIANFIGVSQSKVSRMLALARARGLVHISVPEYEPRNQELERALKETLDVDSVVIRSVVGLTPPQLRQTIGYFAAPIVQQWLRPRTTVLFAGGRSVLPLALNMRPPEGAYGIRFAEAMGHIDSTPGPYDAEEICRHLARTWRGSVLTMNAPLLFPDRDSCERFLKMEQIQQAMEALTHADIIFAGVGNLDDSVIIDRHVFSRDDFAMLKTVGATGELLGRFYDARGQECQTALCHRIMSLPLAKLRGIPKRVGVIAGRERTAAIVAGIRGSLINTLVVDDVGAAALLQDAKAAQGKNHSRSQSRRRS